MAIVDQILLGVYIGVLTGMFTALLIFCLGFLFQYVAGAPFPATMGLMIGLGAAGLQGGMFKLMRDPAMLKSPVIITALLVVLLITNYSQKRATELAKAAPPKSALIGKIRRKTLSPDVVRQLGRFGQVRVTVTGEVLDLEGYPPLPDALRKAIREGEWSFPADLPIAELESRLAEQLQTEHDLEDLTVDIDQRAQATIAAAPPSGGLSRRVPDGNQATTIEAVVPTGLAQGDEVSLEVDDEEIGGTVLSVKPPEEKKDEKKAEKADEKANSAQPVKTAAGGQGRVAVAIDRQDVPKTIGADVAQFVVEPRGNNREYELVSLLRKGGNTFRKQSLPAGDSLIDQSLASLRLRSEYGVEILAIKRADSWIFAPEGTTVLREGDELFLTGKAKAIEELNRGRSP